MPDSERHYPEYHCCGSCNYCGSDNTVRTNADYEEGRLSQCEIWCNDCSHKDFWAYGWYESSEMMVSRCKTYNFRPKQ